MNREKVADAFVRRIYQRVVEEGVEDMTLFLEKPRNDERINWEKLSTWYRSLSKEDQAGLFAIVREALINGAVAFLVDLDGGAGPLPVDVDSELGALPDDEQCFSCNLAADVYDYPPRDLKEKVQIVPVERGDYLHDL